MLGLRTTAGLDLEETGRRFGCDIRGSNGQLISRLVKDGYVTDDGRVVRPTLAGLAVADAMAGWFEIPTDRGQRA
jgi:coproporphyrinogen III oxidase-like Fe-S oxidoreductase